jgi:hypothetical protein
VYTGRLVPRAISKGLGTLRSIRRWRVQSGSESDPSRIIRIVLMA